MSPTSTPGAGALNLNRRPWILIVAAGAVTVLIVVLVSTLGNKKTVEEEIGERIWGSQDVSPTSAQAIPSVAAGRGPQRR